MKSYTTRRFRTLYAALPGPVRLRARQAYLTFKRHPAHPGLRFKCVDEAEGICSARVGIHYRVLGRKDGDDIIWFWIGPHSVYERILKS
jgi:hypothetical protein